MAKAKKKTKYRYVKRVKKTRRRKRDKRLPISGAVGLAAAGFAKPYGSWSSPIEGLKEGNLPVAFQSGIANLTGITVPMANTGYSQGSPIPDIWKVLNPFDMDLGAAWKTAMWSGVTMGIVNKISPKARQMVDRIPFLGKLIKFA